MSSRQMLCVADYERHARHSLPRAVWAFCSQGAEKQETLRDNEHAFSGYHLIPRVLRGNETPDLSVTLLGQRVAFPVGISPTTYHTLLHPDGEAAVAKAAADAGVAMTLSTMSTVSLEAVSRFRGAPQWMQVYVLRQRRFTEAMIRRADHAGYAALVLTLDVPRRGHLLEGKRARFTVPPHIRLRNVEEALKTMPDRDVNLDSTFYGLFAGSLTWDDVAWIRSVSELPLVLKGILTGEDALLAVEHGASAVWVSNNGGRLLDGAPATLDVVREISEAVRGRGCEVYLDGGVRRGSDVLKALALGARAVFVGRPVCWGLAHSGERGVSHVLQLLKEELERSAVLAGCRGIGDVGPHLVRKRNPSKM